MVAAAVLVLAGAAVVINASMASGQTTVHLVFGPTNEIKTAAFDTNGDGLRLGERIAARQERVGAENSINRYD